MAISQVTFDTIMQVATLGGVVFAVYKSIRNPQIKGEKIDAVMQKSCELKHQFIDEKMKTMSEDLHDIRINHLDHIEKIYLPNIDKDLTKIYQILEDRLPNKK